MERRKFILQGALASIAVVALSNNVVNAAEALNQKPVYFHSLLFWLKPELTSVEKENFVNFFEGLKKLSYVKNLRYGTPAHSAARPVLDATYTYHATMEFNSQDELDAYGKLPGHVKLIQEYSKFWNKMAVHDSILK